MVNKLKLLAQDKEDITIISAYLQDAVTVVADFSFQPNLHVFAMVFNRYIWEEHEKLSDENGNKCCHRIRTGCHFENVIKVTSQNIPQDDKRHVLELLAIETIELENKNTVIELIFAADAAIRLEVELIQGQMLDMGEPWKAACHPKHEVLEALKE